VAIRAQGTALSLGQTPNELWRTDFKGEFLLRNRQYCYPLTVTDHASRYLLTCEALSSTKEDYAFTVFERLFQERGLPAHIRSDNGVPFASPQALFDLSKLAVWWLGIGIERIKPGHPQQNGRHERMHLTLKKEATKPTAANFLQQQARLDDFVEIFNNQRCTSHCTKCRPASTSKDLSDDLERHKQLRTNNSNVLPLVPETRFQSRLGQLCSVNFLALPSMQC
jgi:putative transposase